MKKELRDENLLFIRRFYAGRNRRDKPGGSPSAKRAAGFIPAALHRANCTTGLAHCKECLLARSQQRKPEVLVSSTVAESIGSRPENCFVGVPAANAVVAEDVPFSRGVGHYTAESVMNLTVWLPALFLLGLAILGLMFAFLTGCEKV
ncbi:MAG TPA: hypothetical protein VMG10_06255 [Gemmataceae bacterium]|nr:hypothetical protein [Gemmataceae bacterium]